MAGLTPFQTVGPFLSLGLRIGLESDESVRSPVTIRGRLLDGGGAGIPDGVLEFWHSHLTALGRSLTAPDGSFAVTVSRPRALPEPSGQPQAPHLAVRVLGRGILTQYYTRLYFPDDALTGTDPILALVPEARRQTLIATPLSAGEYRFDIVVQGAGETVFFDL
jgi:protocatechuate 3,4-dioxygenase alpha subunit